MDPSYRVLIAVIRFLDTHKRWTRKQLMEDTGLTRSTVERMILSLHKNEVIHITAWANDTAGRNTVAVYSKGAAPDAKRREALAACQRQRTYVQRKKRMATIAVENTMALWARKE